MSFIKYVGHLAIFMAELLASGMANAAAYITITYHGTVMSDSFWDTTPGYGGDNLTGAAISVTQSFWVSCSTACLGGSQATGYSLSAAGPVLGSIDLPGTSWSASFGSWISPAVQNVFSLSNGVSLNSGTSMYDDAYGRSAWAYWNVDVQLPALLDLPTVTSLTIPVTPGDCTVSSGNCGTLSINADFFEPGWSYYWGSYAHDTVFAIDSVTIQGTNMAELLGPSSGVPEPTSWSLLLCGAALIGACLRRRKAAPRCGEGVDLRLA